VHAEIITTINQTKELHRAGMARRVASHRRAAGGEQLLEGLEMNSHTPRVPGT